ncbi:O-methyltransferase-domain-containing protein [Suillus clintonianus]|uniref:O-methyltransferase-domain-containing protein n=1 Tax=Suillus clintonianus TaxID=1904413 RepID=UPI001B86EA7B|nr:O-methyltransferase-domain-containing protein [Suillus clintonianus]KAG2124432.1 O-methyltransferase-domain-containing protein [Suillus clintonianus]
MAELNEVKVEALLDIINSSAREAMGEYKKTGHGVPGADSSTFHPLDLATDTLALRQAIRLLEGACHQLNAILAPPQHTFVHNYNWACTDVAVRSRIADVLDKHPEGLSVDALANAVNLDKTKTARVLRALSLRGCFKEVERDVFANTRLSLILKSTNNAGCSVRIQQPFPKYGAVLYETMTDQEFARSDETDKSPRAFALRKEGINNGFWEMDDEARDVFHRGMMGFVDIQGASAVLHHYPWDSVSSMVDVGSGTGAISTPLAKMFPHLRITNQDLPDIIVQAKNTWEKNASEALLDGRVEFVPFNFFEESPVVGKDVYYLRTILHDWPDAESTTILRNVRKAMGPNSRVLIHDCVLFHTFEDPGIAANEFSKAPEPMLLNFGAGSHTTYQLDMTMWFLFNSKERTLNEFKIIAQVPFTP